MIKRILGKLFEVGQKSTLLKEKKRLERELEKVRKFPQFGDSQEDNSQEVETFEGFKGLEEKLKKQFKEVKLALEKMDEGEYGICAVCKGKIEPGRLKAYPAATTCVVCSSKRK